MMMKGVSLTVEPFFYAKKALEQQAKLRDKQKQAAFHHPAL